MKKENYVSPSIEIIEVEVENGMAISATNSGASTGGYEEDVWE